MNEVIDRFAMKHSLIHSDVEELKNSLKRHIPNTLIDLSL